VSEVVVLQVRLGDARVFLRLEPDDQRELRAMAHGLGHALSHDASLVDPDLKQLVVTIAREFVRLGMERVSTERAIDALKSITTRLAPAAEIGVALGRERQGLLPRWPSTLRIGMPPPDRPVIWPFDPELVGLLLGVRRLLKREALGDSSADADTAWLEAHGVRVRRVESPDADGRLVLFGAFDERVLDEAIDAERALWRTDGGSGEAASFLGEALGYPPCCVDAHVRVGARDDLTLALALLPSISGEPASPLSQWLSAPLALVSHAPCRLDCARTLTLAGALLDDLERRAPGFRARWHALARRLHVLDEEHGSVALRADGSLRDDEGIVVRHAARLALPTGDDLATILEVIPDWSGLRLRLDEHGRLTDDRGELRPIVAADHRA
jgi:hypothetical protein